MIYLDNAATTKVLDNAAELADIYYKDRYFNPSALYEGAINIKKDIDAARKKVAGCLACDKDEIIFTSGGSESDNTAIFCSLKNKKGRVVTTAGEHLAVYSPFLQLKNRGYDVQFAKIEKNGGVNFEHFKTLINKDTIFVSVIHASNETGAVNDIKKISNYVKSVNSDCIVHSDGIQAFLKTQTNVKDLNVDLYSVSGHKVHCPKGIGALYIKKGVKINPLIFGASQEYGLRAGTENAALICAFGLVCELMKSNFNDRLQKYRTLKHMFTDRIKDIDDFIINNDNGGLENILSVSFGSVKSDIIIQMMSEKNIYLGSGSACSSKQKTSRVLREACIPEKYLEGTIRISFSHFNTEKEIEYAAEVLKENIKKLRNIIKRG